MPVRSFGFLFASKLDTCHACLPAAPLGPRRKAACKLFENRRYDLTTKTKTKKQLLYVLDLGIRRTKPMPIADMFYEGAFWSDRNPLACAMILCQNVFLCPGEFAFRKNQFRKHRYSLDFVLRCLYGFSAMLNLTCAESDLLLLFWTTSLYDRGGVLAHSDSCEVSEALSTCRLGDDLGYRLSRQS